MSARTGYFWEAGLAARSCGPLCPESPDRARILAPENIIAGDDGLAHFGFEPRPEDILALAHDPEYIREVRDAHARRRRFLDGGETCVTADTFSQALWAASAGCEAVDRVMEGYLESAFCAVRPPGHHANAVRTFGFCVFNNAAVAARYAQARRGVGRVLIVDWDVHPGNGTQEIFWEDDSVFTLSFHQADLFPEAGRSDLEGRGKGKGFNRNVPLPAGLPPSEYLEVFEKTVDAAAASFRPDMLIVAAGFDAHHRDRMGGMLLGENDYERMTSHLLASTRESTAGRTVSFLEGGYDIPSLRDSVKAHCRALAAAASPRGR